MDWITQNYPIQVEKDVSVIVWLPSKEQTMVQWPKDRRYDWKRDPTWPTTWPSCEKHVSTSRETREPIGTAKAPFSGYLADEGVTRGVATEVNV